MAYHVDRSAGIGGRLQVVAAWPPVVPGGTGQDLGWLPFYVGSSHTEPEDPTGTLQGPGSVAPGPDVGSAPGVSVVPPKRNGEALEA